MADADLQGLTDAMHEASSPNAASLREVLAEALICERLGFPPDPIHTAGRST